MKWMKAEACLTVKMQTFTHDCRETQRTVYSSLCDTTQQALQLITVYRWTLDGHVIAYYRRRCRSRCWSSSEPSSPVCRQFAVMVAPTSSTSYITPCNGDEWEIQHATTTTVHSLDATAACPISNSSAYNYCKWGLAPFLHGDDVGLDDGAVCIA